MRVADSSYLIEGILRNATLLENGILISPDLALYEVVNTLWKHDALIGDLRDARERIELLTELISTGCLQLVRPDKKLLDETYKLSVKRKLPVYDSVFIALALQLKTDLATFDGKQSDTLTEERGKH